jgi:hypothetical protein
MNINPIKLAGVIVLLTYGGGAIQEASKPEPQECKASAEASEALKNQQATINNLTTIVTAETETLKKSVEALSKNCPK